MEKWKRHEEDERDLRTREAIDTLFGTEKAAAENIRKALEQILDDNDAERSFSESEARRIRDLIDNLLREWDPDFHTFLRSVRAKMDRILREGEDEE